MDMRSLNSSLPKGSSPKQSGPAPDQQLLQAFKDAALSVTKLYKTAAAEQVKNRSEGYQDCLDDILAFMDKANIGLSDGEGWRIREWATQRLDGREAVHDSDDESDKERASSPVAQRQSAPLSPTRQHNITSPSKNEPSPPIPEPVIEESEATPPQSAHFHAPSGSFDFRSNIAYPQEVEMSDGPSMDSSLVGQNNSPVTFARANRAGNRNRNNRHNARSISGTQRTGQNNNVNTGSKRKINYSEFFNIEDALNPFGGGGKRTRFT